MRDSSFFYFFTLLFFKERKKHFGVAAISVVMLFLLSSVLFISSSIKYSLENTLRSQPDFVVQKIRGGQRVDLPEEWMDKLIGIPGVSSVTPRVYGRYFFKSKGKSFLVTGVDFFGEQSQKALAQIMSTTDAAKFLDGDNMLVGEAVAKFLKKHFYADSYNFLTPSGKFRKVYIFKVLPKESDLFFNDVIIMPMHLAKEILGIGEGSLSDIAFNVPNDKERDNVENRVNSFYYDLRITSKEDMRKAYENLYNYKGGIFLILFLISIVTFVLILYQRYSMVYSGERRHIGLLRALGWSIRDVLKLKFFETLAVVSVSYITGVFLAYIFVFVYGAPLLKEIFLGGENLQNAAVFVPVLDFGLLASVFLIYAVPFAAAVLVPVWKISVTSPKEAML
jgi:ABC-type lipoprotein release transport system permease subunit